eukprot:PhM_4_TR5674/c0_g1_i1/m.96526
MSLFPTTHDSSSFSNTPGGGQPSDTMSMSLSDSLRKKSTTSLALNPSNNNTSNHNNPSFTVLSKVARVLTAPMLSDSSKNRGRSSMGGNNFGALAHDDRIINTSMTKAFSLAVSHSLAPLWAVGCENPKRIAQPLSLTTGRAAELVAYMDVHGFELDSVTHAIACDFGLATAYIALLWGKLLLIERTGNVGITFEEVAGTIERESSARRARKAEQAHTGGGTNVNETVIGSYDPTFVNDETAMHDLSRRKLTRLGGDWKPSGVVDLHPRANAHRQSLVLAILWATVSHRYDFTHDDLLGVCNDVCNKLFLFNVTEDLYKICGGVKGASYVAKYVCFLCRHPLPQVIDECVIPVPYSLSQSFVLQACISPIFTGLMNLMHSNDTGDIIADGFVRALELVERAQLSQVLNLLHVCLPHLELLPTMLHPLAETLCPYITLPHPIGAEALAVLHLLSQSVHCHDSVQRRHLSSVTENPRVFLLVNPASTRAPIITGKTHLGPVPLQRRWQRANFRDGSLSCLPPSDCFSPGSYDPRNDPGFAGYSPSALDDAVLCKANLVMNVLQVVADLHYGDDDHNHQSSSPIDLALLFSLPPEGVASYYPELERLLGDHANENEKQLAFFGLPTNSSKEVVDGVLRLYNTMVQSLRPLKSRRHRLEAPWYPALQLTTFIAPEESDMESVGLRDTVWSALLDKVQHHQQQHDAARVAICGGGWSLQSFATALIKRSSKTSTSVLRVYPLPLGSDNVLCSWLERRDATYASLVYFPLVQEEVPEVSECTQRHIDLLSKGEATPETLAHGRIRTTLDFYFANAKVKNRVVMYKIEAYRSGRTFAARTKENAVIIPFLSYVELGVHLNNTSGQAINSPGVPPQQNLLSPRTDFSDSSSDFISGNEPGPLSARSATSLVPSMNKGRGASVGEVSLFSPLGRTESIISIQSTATSGHNNNAAASPGLGGGGGGAGRDSDYAHHQRGERYRLFAASQVQIGDTLVTGDRILNTLYLHLPLNDVGGPARYSCQGSEVTTFLSTYYQITKDEARIVAQRCVDIGVLVCVSTDTLVFQEPMFYSVRERNDTDTCGSTPISSRNAHLAAASAQKKWMEGTATPGNYMTPTSAAQQISNGVSRTMSSVGFAMQGLSPTSQHSGGGGGSANAIPSNVPYIPLKITYTPSKGALPYTDLANTTTTIGGNDVIGGKELNTQFLCIKAMGRSHDRGLVPDPRDTSFECFVHDVDRQRRQRATADVGHHYHLDGTLEVEGKHEFLIVVDGEIMGPFVKLAVSPFYFDDDDDDDIDGNGSHNKQHEQHDDENRNNNSSSNIAQQPYPSSPRRKPISFDVMSFSQF